LYVSPPSTYHSTPSKKENNSNRNVNEDSLGTSFLALSLVEAGYEVFANTDASGTFSDKLAFDANRRMEKAGVTLMGMFAIVMDLMRDWYVFFPLSVPFPFSILVLGTRLETDKFVGVTLLVPRRYSHSWILIWLLSR
jgi:hypothetical protein